MTVLVPSDFWKGVDYQLELVDTRGIDEIEVRADLTVPLSNPRVLNVFCSSFSDAPDASVKRLIEHLRESGSDAIENGRVLILVLARTEETQQVWDGTGEMVETDEYAYTVQHDNITQALSRIGTPDLPIVFFNALSDDPTPVWERIIEQIQSIRHIQRQRIRPLASAISRLIDNLQQKQVHQAQTRVTELLQSYIEQYEQLPGQSKPAHMRLIQALRQAHPRSIWASTRRRGDYWSFRVYYHLGNGAQIEARARTQAAVEELRMVIEKMLHAPEMQAATESVEALKKGMEEGYQAFLQSAHYLGEEMFKSALEAETQVWTECTERYGKGSGYREAALDSFEHGLTIQIGQTCTIRSS